MRRGKRIRLLFLGTAESLEVTVVSIYSRNEMVVKGLFGSRFTLLRDAASDVWWASGNIPGPNRLIKVEEEG